MKVSELWLQEWVRPNLTREELCHQLTMAGLEVEEWAPVAMDFTHVVIGKIMSLKPHITADHLTICEVNIGKPENIIIVCGAKNIKVGDIIPVALQDAVLPKKGAIVTTMIQGVSSQGMLCSAVELGLAELGDSLLSLPQDAPLGADVWEYLKLSDFVFDIAITPNRGDCLSMWGIAREVAALTHSPLYIPPISHIKEIIPDTLPITILEQKKCPRYVGRVIKGVMADALTPLWIQERLRRAGIRTISPIVDIMNYIMIELGQPMHAFDLKTISKNIVVRAAYPNEKLKLLDGQVISLQKESLVISDHEKALALAGIMGGIDSSVTLLTEDIFLESAYFDPINIAKQTRYYGLNSESSYRYERGVDPNLQVLAMERATELLLEVVGGNPGPFIERVHSEALPQIKNITFRKVRLNKVLGIDIPNQEIETIFKRLNCTYKVVSNGWEVTIPSYRSDLTLEEDLIEEVARLYGYDKIPQSSSFSNLQIHPQPENRLLPSTLRRTLSDLGFHEVITYSFVDKKSQALFDPNSIPEELSNPITSDMTVMRTNLWIGLLKTFLYNQNRQQTRAKLFEIGLRFIREEKGIVQQKVLSGLISGSCFPEQWGIAKRESDFFDLKGDLETIFKLTYSENDFIFKSEQHAALHPGQAAAIYRKNELMGYIGALHPSILQHYDISDKVFVFELLLDNLEQIRLPYYSEISRFPEIRRDISILVNRAVPSQEIQDTIIKVVGNLLKNLTIFDVYLGKNIALNHKSVALSLTLQDQSRTLRDEEVSELMQCVIVTLKDRFAAELRS